MISSETFAHKVTGRKNLTAEVKASFRGNLFTMEVHFSDEPDNNKTYSSYLYSFVHPLQRGLNIKKGAVNSFRTVYNVIYRNIFKNVWEEKPTIDVGKELKALHSFLVNLQDKFLALLKPEYVKLCRRFPSSRMQYYRFLCDHDHPRIRQMFQSCPGLISAVVVAMEKGIFKGKHVRIVVRMIRNGARIKTILDFIFSHLLHDSYVEHSYFDLWKTIRNFCQNRWESIRKDWIWLTERAGLKVSGRVVLMPPPAFLPKSQIPENAIERSNWYKRIRSFSIMMYPETAREITARQIKGFILMASSADMKFYKYVSRRKAGVVEYLMESTRVPSGGMCYRKFFSEVKTHLMISSAINGRDEDLKKALIEVKEKNKVQDCTWEFSDGQVSIKPLITWDDYQNESKLMSNCVRKLWIDGYRKRVIHFHVIYQEKDYTMEISLPSILPGQVKGFKNSEPPKDLEDALMQIFLKERFLIKAHLLGLGYEFPSDGQTGKSCFLSALLEEPVPF